MNMVGHENIRPKIEEPSIAILPKGVENDARNLLLAQVRGPVAGRVEATVDPGKSIASLQVGGSRVEPLGQTPVQVPGQKKPVVFRVLVRKPAPGLFHTQVVPGSVKDSHLNLPNGLK
jgi:hypothetical protein